jgi:two-component system, sporulation sensor kinase D
MPDGGRLTLRVNRVRELIKFEVEDTGCGIPPHIVDRIFEPFVTHGKANGTGLGMSIAKSIVGSAHQFVDVRQSLPSAGDLGVQ